MTDHVETAEVIYVVGDPKSGKTSFLMASLREHCAKGWCAIYVGGIDIRPAPVGVEEAIDLAHAIELAGDSENVVIGMDEVSLAVTDYGQPEAELRAIAQFRRHLRVRLIGNSQRPRDLPPKVRDIDVSWRLMRMKADATGSTWQFISKRFPDHVLAIQRLTPYWWEPGSAPPVEGTHYLIGDPVE